MNKSYYTLNDLGQMFKMSATAAGKIVNKYKLEPVGKHINKFGPPSNVYSSNDITEDMFKRQVPGTIILNDGTVILPNN